MGLLKTVAFLLLLYLIPTPLRAANPVGLYSPDRNILFRLDYGIQGPLYSVFYKGTCLIREAVLGFSIRKSGKFGAGLNPFIPIFSHADETYTLPVGKASVIRNQYEQAFIVLTESSGLRRRINLIVRVFNDGLAFRFEFPMQKNWRSCSITDEHTSFKLLNNPQVLTLFRESYTTSHEGYYSYLKLNEVKNDTLMDMPSLFEFPGKTFMAITEAALRNYPGMYLKKTHGLLSSALSPLPGRGEEKADLIFPAKTPWRVLLISDRVGALIESNILVNLNEPSGIKDLGWLKPGKSTFHWWNGDVVPDTSFAPGLNFEFNKYYIDFCAKNGFAYHTVIGYGGTAWYVNDGESYAPGPHSDVTRAVAGLDMQKICAYGAGKGVSIRVWVHWKPLYAKLEEAFSRYEKWGIRGLMVDFLDRDDQEMVNIQEEILKKAAEHHLHIQFHGAYKPSGLNRTFPNEFTREGTLNYENNKWGPAMSADHDINMPFTRLLAGATDYHLGGFRAVSPDKFSAHYIRPLMTGSRCHMLAMYVVLESYLGMVCDYPDAYTGEPGFEFIKEVPTVWDETRVPAAEVRKFIVLARRKNSDWYLGGITNSEGRTLAIPLDFLGKRLFRAEIYADADDVRINPNHLKKEIRILSAKNTLTLKLAPSGGFAIHLKELR